MTGLRTCCAVPLFGADADWLVRIAVELDGETAHYQLVVAARQAAVVADAPATALIARVRASDGEMLLLDAVYDATFRARLGSALARGDVYAHGGARWHVRHVGYLRTMSLDVPARLGRAEQSNSSILYGETAILKLFRRLEAGENPDVEIGAFLTGRTQFRHVPRLLATVVLETEGDEPMLAGMLQELVPSSGDGWSDVLAKLRPYIAQEGVPVPFLDEARALGHITRALHAALADAQGVANFTAEPVDATMAQGWVDTIEHEITTTLSDLRARVEGGALAADVTREVDALLVRSARVFERLAVIRKALADGAGYRIRHHGDFHLGQVLRTLDGTFVVIDFEGEPARPLQVRRQKHCPLRDVAGMMRSFGYAAAVTQRDATGQGVSVASASARARVWDERVCAVFVEAYLTPPPSEPQPFLPASQDATRALLELFLLEKAFYELRYEINHRPDWLWVPLVGIQALLEGT